MAKKKKTRKQAAPPLPGMTCKLEIVHKTLEDVLLVPKQAVTKDGEKHYCNVMVENRPEKREVVKGDENDEHVVILEGLKEGDRILMK